MPPKQEVFSWWALSWTQFFTQNSAIPLCILGNARPEGYLLPLLFIALLPYTDMSLDLMMCSSANNSHWWAVVIALRSVTDRQKHRTDTTWINLHSVYMTCTWYIIIVILHALIYSKIEICSSPHLHVSIHNCFTKVLFVLFLVWDQVKLQQLLGPEGPFIHC